MQRIGAILALLCCVGNSQAQDTTPPSIVISTPADGSNVSGSGFLVAGTASDDVALSKVEVQIDGGAFNLASGTASWTYTVGSLPQGTHTITAKATDTSGNSQNASITVNVPPPPDTTSPNIAILSPSDGASVSGSGFPVSGTASDNVALSKVEVQVDNGVFNLASGLESWSYSVGALTAGNHTVTAKATDTSGNAQTTSITVTVPDTTAPNVAITTPSNGANVPASGFTMGGSASDNVALSKVEVQIDSGPFNLATGLSSWSYSVGPLAEGSHTLTAKATDTSGNSATASISVTVPDTTPPVISGESATNITATSATIVWNTNEASDSQVEYGLTTSYGSSTALDSAMVTSHSQGLSGLSRKKTYHYRVKSRDAAGNLAVSPDRTFTTLSH